MILGFHSVVADKLNVPKFWCCSRAMGNTGSAVTYYEESAEFLSKMPAEDLEVNFEI